MHDVTSEHWHEPEGRKNAGYGAWKRPNTPYDDFMEAQGIPIFRGIGVKRVQDMPLKRWNRMGGNGTFIQLYGTEGKWGCYVIEVPGAGALNPERHMYEEIMVVVEGRGTTEIWTDDQKKPHTFEWQRGSMFSIPLNCWHRIVNAASSPALILVPSTGRYSKAHAHMSSAVLVCLKGKGYTYTWPRTDGMTPWKDGKTQNIYRQDYEPVGIVTAAPYGGDWFHAHFGISKEPLRLIGWYGPNNHRKDKAGVPGEKDTDEGAIDVTEGGTAIPYWLEDPFLRREYEETLGKEGVKSQMADELYRAPATV